MKANQLNLGLRIPAEFGVRCSVPGGESWLEYFILSFWAAP